MDVLIFPLARRLRVALFFLSRLRHHAFRSISLCLLGVCALACPACKSDYPAAARQNRVGEERGGAARDVKTARVVEMAMGRSVTVSGTLAAYDQ
ncbi:MAG: hypothetical protein WCF57_10905, partial [Pyrinomonadaceae bacterium]